MAKTWKFSKPVVLASASPRRKMLLEEMVKDLEIIPAEIDESGIKESNPMSLVKELSRLKAEAVAKDKRAVDKIVIGADTVVYLGKIYGKPQDRADAIKILSELSGREHYVYTGVTVICGGKQKTFSVRSAVQFKNLDEEAIERYVDEHSPYDKAGAYAVQDGVTVKCIKGSLSNVIGLPTERLKKVLRGVRWHL